MRSQALLAESLANEPRVILAEYAHGPADDIAALSCSGISVASQATVTHLAEESYATVQVDLGLDLSLSAPGA